MSIGTFGSPIKKVKGETVSLTTTAAHLAVEKAYHEVMLYCSSAWRMALAPKIKAVFVYTAATATYSINYEPTVTDRTTSHMPLDAMLVADICYIGTTEPTRGFYIDLHATNLNANAASLDVEYSSAYDGTTITWTDVSTDSDGTLTGTETLSTDGLYAFVLPATVECPVNGVTAHWIRFKPSATLSATIDVQNIIPAADTVNYAYMEAGQSYQFSLNRAEVGAFEFDHTATGTLDVSWILH